MMRFNIIYLYVCLIQITKSDFENKIAELNSANRESRSCAVNMFGPHFMEQNSKNYLLSGIFVFLSLLFILILLGIIKAILGWFGFTKIGMFGLEKLIDLPRPLDYYQEIEIICRPVEYDIVGWPVHPDTKERTVRTITKTTEFCLNVIFFTTYPVVMCINCCSLCFQTYDNETDDDKCFQRINKIVVAGKHSQKPPPDTYNDDDNDEEEDTKYVLNQMHRSEERLKKKEHV